MVAKKLFDVEKVVLDLVLSDNPSEKMLISKKIIDFASVMGAYPASINELYFARGRGEVGGK